MLDEDGRLVSQIGEKVERGFHLVLEICLDMLLS